MKIENAKNLLIAIKEQIAKNLPDEDSLQFTKEFNNLIDNRDNSISYTNFCIKLLERVKLNVGSDNKQALLAVNNVINLFKNNGTREEFIKAASASSAAYAAAAYSAYASAAAAAAYSAAAASSASSAAFAASASAAYASAASAASASSAAFAAYAAAAYDASASAEYKQQSIDLLQVLKTKAGRPKGSKNFIKKEKNVKILIPESLLSRVKKFINKLLNNKTN